MSIFKDYRRPVERLDARRRRWIRWAAFAASTIVGAVVLLDAGVDPSKLYGWLRTPAEPSAKLSRAAPVRAPRAVLPEQTSTVPAMLPGTKASIAKSPQRLILTGIVLGRNFKEGYAMLGVARENPQTYAAGAVLANYTRLTEIHATYVVLERAGRSARLYLDGAGSLPEIRGAKDDILSIGEAPQSAPAMAMSTEPVTDYLRPAPIYDGESLVGYQVYPGSKPGVFAQMGLRAGDVITAIGGAPLSDPVQATEVFHELVNGMVLSAAVTRNGKTEQVTLDGGLIRREQERAQQVGMASVGQAPIGGAQPPGY
jgi:general secretion pathway protein C